MTDPLGTVRAAPNGSTIAVRCRDPFDADLRSHIWYCFDISEHGNNLINDEPIVTRWPVVYTPPSNG